jgi:hypothetical protein
MSAIEDARAALAQMERIGDDGWCLCVTDGAQGEVVSALRALIAECGLAIARAGWEYAYRDDDGHAWPYGERDEEEGTTLEEIQLVSTEDWWESETDGCSLHRRIKAVPAGAWEQVES